MYDEKKVVLNVPEFSGNNIPVKVAARILGKDPQFVRQGIVRKELDIGVAFKKDGSSMYSFYISPFKLWLLTGYVYRAEDFR